MRMFKRLYLAAGLAGLMLMAAIAARAADSPLNYIPKEADVVIGVNIRAIADSELFVKLRQLHPEADAQIAMIKNMVGVDITKDLDRISVFGRMNKKEVGGVIAQGKFDQEKLLTMLKANGQYKSADVDGVTIHQWYDEKDKRVKYGAFLPGDLAVIWNNEATMKASLAAAKDPTKSLAGSPEVALIPAEAANAAAGILAINREQKGPAAKWHISAIFGMVTITPTDISACVSITPDSAEVAPKFADILRGLVAFGQLQTDNKPLSYVAGRTKVEASEKAVTLTTSVEQSKLEQLVAKKTGKK